MTRTTQIEIGSFASKSVYQPTPGDLIIWRKWFTTWYGLVVANNIESDTIAVQFEGSIPLLMMLTSEPVEARVDTISRSEFANNKAMSIVQSTKAGLVFYV